MDGSSFVVAQWTKLDQDVAHFVDVAVVLGHRFLEVLELVTHRDRPPGFFDPTDPGNGAFSNTDQVVVGKDGTRFRIRYMDGRVTLTVIGQSASRTS